MLNIILNTITCCSWEILRLSPEGNISVVVPFLGTSRIYVPHLPSKPDTIQGGAPSSYKLVINPLTIDISPTKTIVIGVMFTNLAILRAPPCTIWGFPKIGLPQKRWMVYSEKKPIWNGFGDPISGNLKYKTWSGWWFGTFFIFPYIGNNNPKWLIFFRGVGQPPTSDWCQWYGDCHSEHLGTPNFPGSLAAAGRWK